MVRMESVMLITIIAIKYSNKTKNNKKPNVEFSTAQEKKDKDSNTIFSFRITNNNLSKSIDHD